MSLLELSFLRVYSKPSFRAEYFRGTVHKFRRYNLFSSPSIRSDRLSDAVYGCPPLWEPSRKSLSPDHLLAEQFFQPVKLFYLMSHFSRTEKLSGSKPAETVDQSEHYAPSVSTTLFSDWLFGSKTFPASWQINSCNFCGLSYQFSVMHF